MLARIGAVDSRRRALLDGQGRVLAVTGATAVEARASARGPHVRRALAGAPALSDAISGLGERVMVELAVPFDAGGKRRVLVTRVPAELVRSFTDGFFASASAIPGYEGFLLDGARRTLSAKAPGKQRAPRTPSAELATRLSNGASGSYDDRTFVSAVVPGSRWRVVISVPSEGLYASVNGGPRNAALLLLVAFTAAVCALLALSLSAVRSARRLAAATEREHAARALAHERSHDPLTGLPSRLLFEDRAQHALLAAQRRGGTVAVAFVDVDDFKRINDWLGHAGGDAVLREVARRLDGCVRASDTVSRFGGDEFIVLCEDLDRGASLDLVSRMQRQLEAPIEVGGRRLPVTVSIGVAVCGPNDAAQTAGELMHDADTAMYRAKDRGRGRIEVFDGAVHQHAAERLDAEVALRHAIDAGELVVFYQPIVTLADRTLHGVEALVRWRRSDTGELVAPSEFIPLAEETGLISDLGRWVLREAIRELGGWAASGLINDTFQLSVNVSARQLADPLLPETVGAALGGWDRPAASLCLELTETAVMADTAAAGRMLDRLDALGVQLALDDFGVGHSSLGQLARSLPISVLKLDRSFVAEMAQPRERGIVQAAAMLASALTLSSVAEGVETAEQAEQLADLGFPYAQGFYFGRPGPAEQIVALLERAADAAIT